MKTLEILLLILGCTAVLVVAGVLVLRMMVRRFFREVGKDVKGVARSIGYMARMGRPKSARREDLEVREKSLPEEERDGAGE